MIRDLFICIVTFIVIAVFFTCDSLGAFSRGVINTASIDSKERPFFSKMLGNRPRLKCIEGEEESLVFCKISEEPTMINDVSYYCFVLSDYSKDITGYLRMENDILYYLLDGASEYPSGNLCSQEQVLIDFNAEVTDGWIVNCAGCLGRSNITYLSSSFNDDVQDTVYQYKVTRLQTIPPHVLVLTSFSASKEYGFLTFNLSTYDRSEEPIPVCTTYYFPN